MRDNRWFSAAILSSALASLSACALLNKSAPLTARYFAPDIEVSPPKSVTHLDDRRLRLGRIQASAHLRERMAYRASEEELGYYEDRRWTERPESYLRRALSRSLFEVRGVVRAVSGAAPTLDAELTGFEEIKDGEHRVRVQVVMILDDSMVGSLERTITVERKVAGTDDKDPKPVVQALADALSETVEQMCDQIVERLAAMPPPPSPSTPPPGTTTSTVTTTSVPPAPIPER